MPDFIPKNILVTTDLSPESSKAYPHAKSLAKAYKAQLTLLCCIDTSIQFGVAGTFDMPVMYVPEVLSTVSERTLKALKEHLERHFPEGNINSELIDRPLPVHNTIVEFIKESGVDLVVIASHGRSGLSRAFLGSVAEQVVRHSSKPALVVPLS
jgi:nucleotide-binding universal stress UspA family protein